MITLLYRIYQFIICLPGIVLMTIITAIEVGLGTTLGKLVGQNYTQDVSYSSKG